VRAHNDIGEAAHLNPSVEQLSVADVLNGTGLGKFNRSVATNVRVTHGEPTNATVHETNHGGVQAVVMVKSDQLVSHPEHAGVFGRRSSSSTHER